MASAYEVANPDPGSRRGPKQKGGRGIYILPPIETGLYEEGEILGSLNAWIGKETKEKEAFQNCWNKVATLQYKKR